MATSLDGNAGAREAILARVRKALGKTDDSMRRDQALRHVAARARGPQPASPGDVVERFVERATHMESTVERIASRADVPAAVARYLDALVLPDAIAVQ